MDYSSFVDGEKTLLIAPAGYGKTYTIVECLKHTTGCQLILTHTHAGVGSLKEKIKKANISSNKYRVETISSFAQKYVNSFYMGNDIPNQEDFKSYHPFIINQAKSIFKSDFVKIILKATYSGLFVDEYQDCNKPQHEMILALAESLKTHVLGDPLQGIFDFNNDALVDFDIDLARFIRFPDLSTPFRWYQEGNNKELGDFIKEVRNLLTENKDIDIESKAINGLFLITVNAEDIRDSKSYYRKCLDKLIRNPEQKKEFNSLLIIVPEYIEKNSRGNSRRGDIHDRAQIRALIDYSKSLILIEAIDDKSFYTLAKEIDTTCSIVQRTKEPIKLLTEKILNKIFLKTEMGKWINGNEVITKRDREQHNKAKKLRQVIDYFLSQPTPHNIEKIILVIKDELKVRYSREGLLYAIINALTNAEMEGKSVYESMKNQRNSIRRIGRKVDGKCIGTTLLTKGLEFDTVAILDADKFNNPKQLYVALTRCCKQLIVFSSKGILSPYC